MYINKFDKLFKQIINECKLIKQSDNQYDNQYEDDGEWMEDYQPELEILLPIMTEVVKKDLINIWKQVQLNIKRNKYLDFTFGTVFDQVLSIIINNFNNLFNNNEDYDAVWQFAEYNASSQGYGELEEEGQPVCDEIKQFIYNSGLFEAAEQSRVNIYDPTQEQDYDEDYE